MDHKIWYEKDDEIIHLEFTRDYLTSDVPRIREKILELSEGKRYKQMVIQISKTSKVENRETRELSNKVLGEAQITDIAFIGGSAANRMIAKVLLKTGAIKINGDFFKSLDDGINWIKSRR
jgi:hypothetical protein